MPYIPLERRAALDDGSQPANAGELNFLITELALRYLKDEISYQRINDVLGALEGCKLEFYRRLAAPYEDTKIEANGDVYHSHTVSVEAQERDVVLREVADGLRSDGN